MKKNIYEIISKLNLGTAANKILKEQLLARYKLPSDYTHFIIEHNGAVGFFKDNYLDIWDIQKVLKLNPYYVNEEFSKKSVIIGTNGSGTLFGYNFEGKYFFVTDEFE